ncbi:MAG: DUF763 domain-containing protein [Sulfolobales archaeon]
MWGVADLPLHRGHVPPWLYNIMKRMAKAIVKLLVFEYGPSHLLRRLSNPLWFQALNNAIGMDWDSSGSTTVTTAILREVLNEENLGVWAVGGKGVKSIEVPKEVSALVDKGLIGSNIGSELIRISRLTAKTDSALLQDGFSLYHHIIVFDEKGNWIVIQQGMNSSERIARRYHLSWEKVDSDDVTIEPHTGALCEKTTVPLNLSARESLKSRKAILDLIHERPAKIAKYIHIVNAIIKGYKPLFGGLPRPITTGIPYYRPIKLTERLLKVLNEAYEVSPSSFPELLLKTRAGPETLRALSLVSELIYREPPPLKDIEVYSPFKYAYAIGGKDGVPYPVKKQLAEEVLNELYEIIRRAELGYKDKLRAFRSLSSLAPPDIAPI